MLAHQSRKRRQTLRRFDQIRPAFLQFILFIAGAYLHNDDVRRDLQGEAQPFL
jgi:hypothetical protein